MNFLFLTILFPILGCILLMCFQRFFTKYVVSIIGIGSIALSALVTCFIVTDFLDCANLVNGSFSFVQTIFTWISAVDFYIPVSFRIDRLSLTMLMMITLVGVLVHIYASWYMYNDVLYSCFFSYMNLFVANMIILVLADNILLMYLGWEGVGLCSYLLIGFHYQNLRSGEAALKSFIITRIGDIFLICAIFMLYKTCHILDFCKLLSIISKDCFEGSQNFITVCLLTAAVAKSAQVPLQTWLSNSMEAPFPVSALIHSATMITAGVYLIARTYNLFILTPEVLYVVGIIGSITLIISSCSALVQNDIKKILAYSTMGQIGYMFIALSIQSWESAIFHLVMHAFFKSFLFLIAGSLVSVCCGERNIFKMRGLSYTSVPLLYVSFLVGGSSLSALPIITAGFYSKGSVLLNIMFSGNYIFTVASLFGSFLTVLYTFRMIFIIFHKNSDSTMCYKSCSSSFAHDFPLLVLLVLSSVVGTWIRIPNSNGSFPVWNVSFFNECIFELFINVLIISGMFLSIVYYFFSYRIFFDKFLDCILGRFFVKLFYYGWGFDLVYKRIFIRPYLLIVRLLSFDPVSIVFKSSCVFIVTFLSDKLILSENGQLRYYVISMFLGLVIMLFMLMFL